jgi:D-proline reductase (dithiol) PrdB
MCNQTVSLIAAEIERRGIATVCIMLLREVAEKVRPPRSLVVPFPHGFPLGKPDDAEGQKQIVRAALALLDREAPAIAEYRR